MRNLHIYVIAVTVFLLCIKLYLQSHLGFTTSEYLHLYRAWSLMHFGRDEIGHTLPIIFSSSTGYEHPLLDYILAPLVGLFGMFNAGVLFEVVVWIVPALLLATAYSSFLVGFAYLTIPFFLWPGNWDSKLFCALLAVFILVVKKRSVLLTGIILTLLLLTSVKAILLLPLMMLGFVIIEKVPWRYFVLTVVFSAATLFVGSFIPGYTKNFADSNFGFFTDTELVTTINSLRGEHSKNNVLVKMLHNKSEYLYLFTNVFITGTNPSLVFGSGDRDNTSLTQKVPMLSLGFLLIFILAIFNYKKNMHLPVWIAVSALFLVSLNSVKIYEKELYVFAFAAVLLVGKILHQLTKTHKILFIILTLVPITAFVYFSSSFLPPTLQTELNFGLDPIIKFTTPVFLTDDVFSNPGPYLAYALKPVPPKTKTAYQPRFYIRQVNHIEIVSPQDDKLLTSTGTLIVSQKYLTEHYGVTSTPIVFNIAGEPLLFQVQTNDANKTK